MPKTATSEAMAHVVGGAIRDARRAAGLSQAALASRLDASGPYVAKVEAGRANLTLGQLANFAVALGVDLDVRLVPPARKRVALRETASFTGASDVA